MAFNNVLFYNLALFISLELAWKSSPAPQEKINTIEYSLIHALYLGMVA